MSVCWYCHWGWPKAVRDIYDKFVEEAGWSAMHYGPAHVVWEDENFDTRAIEGCLADAEAGKWWHKGEEEESPDQKKAVCDSLRELLAIPESVRIPRPDYFEDERQNPQDFPPVNVQMSKRE